MNDYSLNRDGGIPIEFGFGLTRAASSSARYCERWSKSTGLLPALSDALEDVRPNSVPQNLQSFASHLIRSAHFGQAFVRSEPVALLTKNNSGAPHPRSAPPRTPAIGDHPFFVAARKPMNAPIKTQPSVAPYSMQINVPNLNRSR